MSVLTVEEFKNALKTVEDGYKAIMGQDAQIQYFRPMSGAFSIRDLAIAKQMGYTTVLWTSLYASEDLSNLDRGASVGIFAIYAVYQILKYRMIPIIKAR